MVAKDKVKNSAANQKYLVFCFESSKGINLAGWEFFFINM